MSADFVDFAALADASVSVVRGVVWSVHVEVWGRSLRSTYEVAVEECWVGTCSELVTVVVPGGSRGDLVARSSGWPVWEEGSDVVVFVPTSGTVRRGGAYTVLDGGRLFGGTEDVGLVDLEGALMSR